MAVVVRDSITKSLKAFNVTPHKTEETTVMEREVLAVK
jgi:hypothetical protein